MTVISDDNGGTCGELLWIKKKICSKFNIQMVDLVSDRTSRESVIPRHIAMLLCRELTTASLPKIGRIFNRDHTSIIHAVRRAGNWIDKYPYVKAKYETIIKEWKDERKDSPR